MQRSVLAFLRRWLLLLLLGPIAGGITGYLVVREIPPVYEASVILQVAQGNVAGTGGDSNSLDQLARTYVEAVKTRGVLTQAAEKIGLALPYRTLQQRVNARLVRDTQLLRISAEDTDRAQAARLADAVAQVFVARNQEAQASRFAGSRDSLGRLVSSLQADIDDHTRQIERLKAQPASAARDAELARLQNDLTQLQSAYGASVRSYEDLRVTEARSANTLTVLESAAIPEDPIRPNRLLVIVLSVLGGFLVAGGFAAGAEYLDDGLRDRQRVATATGLVTLGTIPRGDARDGVAARRRLESYRLLLSNLLVATSDEGMRTLMVASPGIGEGKSTTAANLALVLAETGQRVILVDGDLHRPTQMRLFDLPNRSGFSTLLLNPREPATSVLRPTKIPSLQVITAGPAPADPSALFSSKRLDERIAELTELCDVVVFDTPPLRAQPEAALLSSRVDAALLVLDASKSRRRDAARALEMLHTSGAAIAGVVLNRVPQKSMDYATYGEYAKEPAEPGSSAVSAQGSTVFEGGST